MSDPALPRPHAEEQQNLGEIERGWHASTIVTVKGIADALERSVSDLVRDIQSHRARVACARERDRLLFLDGEN